MLFLFLFTSFILKAEPMLRLDKLSREVPVISEKSIVMFMSQGCSHCKAQVKDFQSCLPDIPVTLFLEGKDEEVLRKELRRAKFPYPVYWTTDSMKSKYKVGNITPTSFLQNGSKVQKIEGRLECDKLRPLADKIF